MTPGYDTGELVRNRTPSNHSQQRQITPDYLGGEVGGFALHHLGIAYKALRYLHLLCFFWLSETGRFAGLVLTLAMIQVCQCCRNALHLVCRLRLCQSRRFAGLVLTLAMIQCANLRNALIANESQQNARHRIPDLRPPGPAGVP